ncbi:MAG: ABC transporter ATP-binding protein [Spirulinaceae cyanobacterium]
MDRSARQQPPIIQLHRISKAFGSHMILDAVDLEIYPGEALVIIGPSGTGKSTILRIIAGLLAPDSGEIYVQGQRRRGLIEDQTDPITISMVFQQAALFDSLTVTENVGFRLFEHSYLSLQEIERLVEERLEMVGLPGVGSQYPAALSGGMRKRVSFARAVMADPTNPQNNPKLILYDEPTAGLDPIASTVIEDLVRDLQRAEGICGTYVMVSHQQSTIRRTADRIIFLYDGRVQWQGTVPDLDTTENPLVRQFFNASTTGPIRVVQ